MCSVLGSAGLAGYRTAMPGPPSMPPAGKILPAYSDHMMVPTTAQGLRMPSLLSGQQFRSTEPVQVSERDILSADSKAETSEPSPIARDVHAAVRNLATLVEPLAGGDVADGEPTKVDSGVAASGIQSRVAGVESTSAGLSMHSSASTVATVAGSPADPDVVGSSVVVSQLGQNTTGSSDQTVSLTVPPTSELFAPALTVVFTATSSLSGITLFSKPSVPTFSALTQITASAGFVFGQPFASTSSKPFGPPVTASGLGVTDPLAQQPTVSSSESAPGPAAVSSVVGGGDISSSMSAPSVQPLTVPATSSLTVTTTFGEQIVAPSVAAVGTTSSAPTLFGHTVSSSSVITLATSPGTVIGQPSTAVAAGTTAGDSTLTPVTSSGEPVTSSVAVTSTAPAAVFGQPPASVSIAAGTTVFGSSTSTPATASVPPLFGIMATSSSSTGTSLFGQLPSSTSSGSLLFGQQTSTPASVATSSVGIFGQPSVMASSGAGTGVFGVFGEPSASTSSGFKPFGFASTSTTGFGQAPSFGKSTFGQSAFGQPSSRSVLLYSDMIIKNIFTD